MKCAECGGHFLRGAERGPLPKYCSAACRQSAHRKRAKASPTASVEEFVALVGIVAAMAPITQACLQYRADLEEAGYSPTMAESIAGEMHRQLIIQGFSQARSK